MGTYMCVRGFFILCVGKFMRLCVGSHVRMCSEDQMFLNVIFLLPPVLHLCNTFIKTIHHAHSFGFPL